MKKQILLTATLLLAIGFSSCKKDKDETPAPTAPQLFINFNLDGVPTSITGTTNSLNTGSGSYTSSAFFDLSTFIDINLAMNQDSILGSDLQSLVGQNLPILNCLGCPTNMDMSFDIGSDTYKTYDTHNPFPANYFKITSVVFCKNVISFGQSLNEYYVSGEFNANLSYGSTIKSATNGTFKMVFQEVKN